MLEIGRPLGGTVGLIVVGTVISGVCALAVWSVAGFWSFPDWLPYAVSLRSWQRYGADVWGPLGETVFVAVVATGVALALVWPVWRLSIVTGGFGCPARSGSSMFPCWFLKSRS